MCTKKVASNFYVYPLIPNSEFQKKKLTKISFSLRKMQPKCSVIARSIGNFAIHHFKSLYLKHIYKKRYLSLKNAQNFKRSLRKI